MLPRPRPEFLSGLILAVLTTAAPLWGAVITSAGTGNWDQAGTWSTGIPNSDDDVYIRGGEEVTVNTLSATAKSVTIYGTLKFSTLANSSLTVTGGDVVVASSGSLTMGVQGNIITEGLHASLVLPYGSSPGEYGLIIQDGGDFQTQGALREPFGYLAESVSGGGTQIKVAAKDSNYWRVGDVLSVGPTSGAGTGTFEEVTVTSVFNDTLNVFTVTPGLASGRTVYPGAAPVVANLTRNVTIRSSSTYAEGRVSYVRNLTSYTTSFAPAYAEFLFLGANSGGKYGLNFDPGAKGSVSSCTLREGYDGFYAAMASSMTLVGNILYKNADHGLRLIDVSSASLRGNVSMENNGSGYDISGNSQSFDIYLASNAAQSNGGDGFSIRETTGTRAEYNFSLSNAARGFYGWPLTRAVLVSNSSLWNTSDGYLITECSGSSFQENGAYSNGGRGFYFPHCGRALFGRNGSVMNTGNGFVFESAHSDSLYGNVAVMQTVNFEMVSSSGLWMAQDVSTGGGTGFYLEGCNDARLAGPLAYSNTGTGVQVKDSTGVFLLSGVLGFTEAGAAAGDTVSELSLSGTGPVDVTLYQARVNPSPGISTAGLDREGARIASYHQDQDTGTVRVWGDYRVAGTTLTLDYSAPLYASTATAPRLIRGAGHSLTVVSVSDAYAVTQLVSVEYRGGQWHVDGSSTGVDMAVFTAPQSGLSVPASGAQFVIDFTEGGSPEEGDRLDFLLSGSPSDSSVQKKLLIGDPAAGFNDGKSRIIVEPDGGVVLKGSPGYPALLDRLDGSSTYYTFVDSGAFTAHYASMTNMDSKGLQLSGSAGVSLATAAFDFLAVAETTSTYLTLRDLASAATFYGLQFGASTGGGLIPVSRNIFVQGDDSALDWILRRWSGALSGEADGQGKLLEADPNGKVRWAPFTPDAAAVPLAEVFETSASASWAPNANPAGTTYLLQASTDAAFGGAASSSTLNLSEAVTGLDRNSTYYFRVAAVDIATSTFRDLGSTITLSAPVSPAAVPYPGVGAVSVQAAWAAFPASPSSASAAGYKLEASSTGFPGTGVVHSSTTMEISLSTLTVGTAVPMESNTTYYFRAASLNKGGSPNYALLGTTSTLALPPSANGDPFLWVAGASVTVQWAAMPAAPQALSAEGYILQASTSDVFGGILYSTSTDNLALSTLTLAGLGGFVTYYFRVGSLNHAGAPDFLTLGSTAAPRQYVRIKETNNLFASTDLSWGDYDNDGDPDIAVANEGGGDVYLMRNNGNGTFTALVQAGTGGDSRAIDWGDYDGDGDLDLAVANYDEEVYLLRNDGGAFVKVAVAGSTSLARGIAFGDYDGDGDLDLGVANGGNQDAILYRNDGAQGFTRFVQSGSFGDSWGTAWGDMDGDGDLDLVVANAGGVGTEILINDGTDSFQPVGIPGSGGDSRDTALGDYDGDGDLDIAVANANGEDTYLIRNDGGASFTKLTQTGSGGNSYGVAWGDHDSDGDLDLFVANAAGATSYLLINEGGDSFAMAQQPDMDGDSRAVAWADYDLDGDLDMVVANYSGEDVYYLRNGIGKGNPPPDRPAFSPDFSLDFQGSTTALTVRWDTGDYDNTGDTRAVSYALAVSRSPMSLSADQRRITAPSEFQVGWPRVLRPAAPGAPPLYQTWPGDGGPREGVVLRVDYPNGSQGNLKSDATYYFRVQAVDRGMARSSWSVEVSTYIYAPVPLGSVSVFEAFESSLAVVLSTTRASSYFVDASTSADFTTIFSTSGLLDAATGFAVTGLGANTTYFLRVGSLWQTATTYGSVSPASTSTLAAMPQAAASTFTAVDITSMTVSWDEGDNPVDHTTYTVTLSTSADFVNTDSGNLYLSTAPAGTLPTGTITSLIPNTTYHVFIKAVNHNGIAGAYRHFWSTSTRSAPPSGAGYPYVGLSSMTVSWGRGGNPVGRTTYTVVLSSGPSWPNSFTGNVSTTVAPPGSSPEAAFEGLELNTTYYAFGWTRSHLGFISEIAALGSTATLSATVVPLDPAFTGVERSSMSVYWGGNGNPIGTSSFTIVLSTGSVWPNSYSGNRSVSTAPASSPAQGTVTGLIENTTYFAFGASLNHGGVPSSFTALGSTSTLAAPPIGGSGFYSVQEGGVQFWWAVEAPAKTVIYTVEASTAPDFSMTSRIAFDTAPFDAGGSSPTASFSGLSLNTTHYFRVRALNHNGIPTVWVNGASTSTLAAGPAGAVSTFPAVTASSITVSWYGYGNPLDVTTYTVVLSTGFSYPNSFSGNSVLSTAPAGSSPTAVLGGLVANTTYSFFVRAVNHNGIGTGFTGLGSTVTLAADPASAVSTFPAVFQSSMSAAWDRNGNAVDITTYTVALSTALLYPNSYSGSVEFSTAPAGEPLATLEGLVPNTTYFFFVRGVNHLGGVTDFIYLGSTTTLPMPPAAAGTPFAAVHRSSAQARWDHGGNPEDVTVYSAALSTGSSYPNAFTGNVEMSTVPAGAVPAASFSGLAANTTYYFFGEAVGHRGLRSGFVLLGSTVTLAYPPAAGAGFLTVGASSLTAAWDGNSNPVDLTSYTVVLTTSPGYPNAFTGNVTLTTAPAGAGPAATLSGLIPNTTYSLFVQAMNHSGEPTGFTALGSTLTRAAPPGGAPSTFTAVGVSSLTVAWDRSSNPVDVTTYTVALSTGAPYPNSFTGNSVFETAPPGASPAAVFSGLEINTTYYFFASARDFQARDTEFSSFGATATYAVSPGGASLSAVRISSASLGWDPNGNPAGTMFEAQASTDGFSTINVASRTANASVVFEGLASNTTLYFRLRALNWSAVGSSYTAAGSTITRVAEPLPALTEALGTDAVAANWEHNGNQPGTGYYAEISTDDFGTVTASSSTRNNFAGFTGLVANTTYYLRARAVGLDGTPTAFVALPSTVTYVLPPGAAAVPMPSVDIGSAAVRWTSGGNSGGTQYIAEISTDAFLSSNLSSVTVALEALFGAGGAGPDLAPDTSYYFRVRSVGAAGPGSPVTIGSTITLAAVPSGTALVAVSSASVELDWLPNGNREPGTGYEVERDTVPGFTQAVTAWSSTSVYTASGLAGDTTYYFRVRAVNGGGRRTIPDVTVSTRTRPSGPGTPGAASGVVLGVSSISWSWSVSSGALRYQVVRASDGAVVESSTPTASFFQTGLATNTAYGIRVRGRNDYEFGALSPSATVYTWAEPPSGLAWSTLDATSATVVWSSGTNPGWTVAELDRSTDGAAYVLRSSGAFSSFLDPELEGCTTYWYRVRYLNGDGLPTDFDAALQFMTTGSTPLPAGALTATSLEGRRIRLDWEASASSAVTAYRLYFDSGTEVVDFGTPLAVLSSTETSYTTEVLTASAAYKFSVRAFNRCGLEDEAVVTASAEAADTLAGPRAVVGSLASGVKLRGTGVTVKADLERGDISQVRSILFQFKRSDQSSWSDMVPVDAVTHPNPAVEFPYYIHWNFSAVPSTGSYDLRAKATDTSDVEDTGAPSITVTLVGSSELAEVIEDVSGGNVVKSQLVYQNASNTVETAGAASKKVTKVVVPAGALNISSRTLTLDPGPAPPAAAPAGTAALGILAQVSLQDQTALAGGKTAAVTLSYPDANGDGIVDGTPYRAADLLMLSNDGIGGGWLRDVSVSVDLNARSVTGLTSHFSFFGLFVPTHLDLTKLRVYPNPFKPNSGSVEDGTHYSPADLNSGIIFDQLPPGTAIRIYTVAGQKVAELSGSDSSRIQWDVRNDSGRDVASGGYLAVITSPGQKDVVRKLLIVR